MALIERFDYNLIEIKTQLKFLKNLSVAYKDIILKDCEKFIFEAGEPKSTSAKQEKFEQVFNNYFV